MADKLEVAEQLVAAELGAADTPELADNLGTADQVEAELLAVGQVVPHSLRRALAAELGCSGLHQPAMRLRSYLAGSRHRPRKMDKPAQRSIGPIG